MNQVETKECSKCHQIKPITEFNIRTDRQIYRRECKNCQSIYHKQWCIKHCTEIKEKKKIEYWTNKETNQIKTKIDRKNNPEKYRELRLKDRLKNAKYYKDYIKKYFRNRRINDPKFKTLCNIRSRINHALNRNIKNGHTLDLLGCDLNYNDYWLESQFYNNMNWDNQGIAHNGWQIHHICPIEYFDITDPIEQKQAFHYSNTVPLWYADHCEEHRKINERMSKYENNGKPL